VNERTRPAIDFGAAATDYTTHRPGFPAEAFDAFAAHDLGRPGQWVLDLGTGTGSLARGFAARGCRVIGLDPSPGMLEAARALPHPDTGTLGFVRAWAETVPIRDRACDLVCAGQCWHWFDRARAAAEVARLLAPRGRAVIAYFTYLGGPGTPGRVTDDLVLAYHPGWIYAHHTGRWDGFFADLTGAGLTIEHVIDQVVEVPFTHAAWRGRFRACNGVLVLPPDRVQAFDAELAVLLVRRWPDPFVVEHRFWAVIARRADAH
jgi:SAM-dependent methyltransferase